MWFVLGVGLVIAAIMVAALVSDVGRRQKLRRLAQTGTGDIGAAHRRGRAGIDVRNDRAGVHHHKDYGGGAGV